MQTADTVHADYTRKTVLWESLYKQFKIQIGERRASS